MHKSVEGIVVLFRFLTAMKQFIVVIFIFLSGVLSADVRTFKDSQGNTLDGELVSATDKEAKIRKKDGSIVSVRVDRLSKEDQAFVKEHRTSFIKKLLGKGAAANTGAVAKDGPAGRIVQFVKDNLGNQVGNGECWTLANEAFKNANIKRPGKDLRVWGRLVDHTKEELQPGDIVELNGAVFGNGMKFYGNHTSVVVAADKRGNFTVMEQNINGKRFVQQRTYQLSDLKSGSLKFYRYVGKS